MMRLPESTAIAKRLRSTAVLLLLGFSAAASATDTLHKDFQATGFGGTATYLSAGRWYPGQTFSGVVLNDPAQLIDNTSDTSAVDMGGEWQIFIQTVAPNDWGGTTAWMGQNYATAPFPDHGDNYSETDWYAELDRVNYGGLDPATHDPLRAGDLVRITANGTKTYRGKQNINEEHWDTPDMDFHVEIVQRDYGLPAPHRIYLSDVRDGDNLDIFVPTDPDGDGVALGWDAVAGGEKYQSQWTTVQNVSLVPGQEALWANDAELEVTDATGRTFPLKLGLHPSLAAMAPPTGTFDVTGIFDQEGPWGPDVQSAGYRLWVLHADDLTARLPGDLTGDGFVGADDLAAVQLHWGQATAEGNLTRGDASGDGFVGADDLAVVQLHWGQGNLPAPPDTAVPEPSALAGLLMGLAVLARRRSGRH